MTGAVVLTAAAVFTMLTGAASARDPASRRRNHQGAHQFHSPRSVILAGTSSIRTSEASRATITARARPISLTAMRSPDTNARKTATMMRAAKVAGTP